MITKAIRKLCPTANWNLNGETYEGLEWYSEDIAKPTKQEIEDAIVLVQAEIESTQYQRLRAAEYPSIADQLDTLYHGGLDAWKAQIKTVKDKYPKA
jgi:hypothetical protein